jgi:hypothetical protein
MSLRGVELLHEVLGVFDRELVGTSIQSVDNADLILLFVLNPPTFEFEAADFI